MELTFQKEPLLHSLQVLQGVASGRNTLPILSNVLIRAEAGNIECIATDLEVGIRVKVDGAIQEEGAITVSAKKLADIVKELPAEDIRLTTTANDRVELECGNGVYKIIGLPDEEFPQLPSVDGEALNIDGETLRGVLAKTEFAASTEEVRYFLNGLYFNLLEERTEVVATDGRQLALAHFDPLTPPEGVTGFIVPLKAVREIAKTFASSDSVNVSIFENQILFSDEHATLTTRLVEGEYPKYEKIIPEPEATEGRTVLNREAMLRATRRVSLLSNPKNYSVCLEINEEEPNIRISAKTPELGEAHETVGVESCTKSVRIGFDARLLMEALAHIDAENIQLEFSGELNPVVAKPAEEPGHTCLIMPMRLES